MIISLLSPRAFFKCDTYFLTISETGRLENELKKQRHTYDEEISLLKERIAYLEETSSAPKTMKDSPTKKPNERSVYFLSLRFSTSLCIDQ